MKSKKGFTIVELLVTIAILAILMGIVTTAVSGAMRSARGRRAQAIIAAVSAGINAYHAANDEWPGNVISQIENKNTTVVKLTDAQADQMIREVVKETVMNGKTYIDPSALFVALNNPTGCNDQHTKEAPCRNCKTGKDFMAMWHGDAHSSKNEQVESFCFGYPGKQHGRFCRFVIKYNLRTDSITVAASTNLD